MRKPNAKNVLGEKNRLLTISYNLRMLMAFLQTRGIVVSGGLFMLSRYNYRIWRFQVLPIHSFNN